MKDYKKMSYWLESSPYQENLPLKDEIEVDVAIIGGGFTGLSSAYYINQRHPASKIALLEAEVVGYGASGRNGGFSMPLMGWDITYLLYVFNSI